MATATNTIDVFFVSGNRIGSNGRTCKLPIFKNGILTATHDSWKNFMNSPYYVTSSMGVGNKLWMVDQNNRLSFLSFPVTDANPKVSVVQKTGVPIVDSETHTGDFQASNAICYKDALFVGHGPQTPEGNDPADASAAAMSSVQIFKFDTKGQVITCFSTEGQVPPDVAVKDSNQPGIPGQYGVCHGLFATDQTVLAQYEPPLTSQTRKTVVYAFDPSTGKRLTMQGAGVSSVTVDDTSYPGLRISQTPRSFGGYANYYDDGAILFSFITIGFDNQLQVYPYTQTNEAKTTVNLQSPITFSVGCTVEPMISADCKYIYGGNNTSVFRIPIHWSGELSLGSIEIVNLPGDFGTLRGMKLSGSSDFLYVIPYGTPQSKSYGHVQMLPTNSFQTASFQSYGTSNHSTQVYGPRSAAIWTTLEDKVASGTDIVYCGSFESLPSNNGNSRAIFRYEFENGIVPTSGGISNIPLKRAAAEMSYGAGHLWFNDTDGNLQALDVKTNNITHVYTGQNNCKQPIYAYNGTSGLTDVIPATYIAAGDESAASLLKFIYCNSTGLFTQEFKVPTDLTSKSMAYGLYADDVTVFLFSMNLGNGAYTVSAFNTEDGTNVAIEVKADATSPATDGWILPYRDDELFLGVSGIFTYDSEAQVKTKKICLTFSSQLQVFTYFRTGDTATVVGPTVVDVTNTAIAGFSPDGSIIYGANTTQVFKVPSVGGNITTARLNPEIKISPREVQVTNDNVYITTGSRTQTSQEYCPLGIVPVDSFLDGSCKMLGGPQSVTCMAIYHEPPQTPKA